MTYIPTCKQFREARKILDITQMEVDGQTEIPQTAISQIENGKHVGQPRYKPFGPNYHERLRKFFTGLGIAFPVDGSTPIRVDVRVFFSDLPKEFENWANSAKQARSLWLKGCAIYPIHTHPQKLDSRNDLTV